MKFMPRRSIERPTKKKREIIDLKTGKRLEKTSVPLLCEKIRLYREKEGLEQKKLAKLIGVTGNAVSNWENGRGRPDINLLPDICNALNVTMYDLFDVEAPDTYLTKEDQHFLRQYKKLTEGHRMAIEQMTDTLINVQEAENIPSIKKLTYFKKQLAAGIGDPTEFEDAGEIIYLYSSRQVDRSDCVFSVSGDSMEPVYHDGDMVLVSRIPDAPELQPGETGAFIAGNETYIKVYDKEGLKSLNQNYPVMRFSESDSVYLIGRVMGILDPEQIATSQDIEKYKTLCAK